jgi:DNA-binding NarL/FixJ family response regulator
MSDDRPTRVLVVDDHQIVAGSLRLAIDAEDDLLCVGTAGSLAEGRSMIRTTAPDVLLLDHRLPDGDGVAALPELLDLRPTMAVVIVTGSAADQVLLDAIAGGAAGFISKTRDLSELTSAVRAAALGESVISPSMLARLLPRMRRGTPSARTELTEREREVLALMSEGLSNQAIADRLVVSVHTVRNHVANLSSKLGAHSKLEALSIAIRNGLLPSS